jgi:uncharacterized membrane protein YoaK (UPF0700 family)
MLLATTGGLLDAFVYLNHGHVFANAMTGNVIFLGIAILGRDWTDIFPHLVPLVGFFAGILTSKHLRARMGIRSAPLGLGLEIVAIFVFGWLPRSFPEMAFTGIIAYVAAFQVASFRRVDRFTYNSTFITGNLRDVADGVYDALAPASTPEAREKGLSEARALGLISLCFLAGAILGAWAAPRFGNHSLWLAEPFLLAIVALSFIHNPPNTEPPSPTSAIHPDPKVVLYSSPQIVTLASLATLGRSSFDPVIHPPPCVLSPRRRSPERLRLVPGKTPHSRHHHLYDDHPTSPRHHSRLPHCRQRPRRRPPHRRSPHLPLRS